MGDERKVSPLIDGWPNLTFLGLGAWWAWIWLCYSSIEITQLFPEQEHGMHVFLMYLVSTMGIALCMFVAARYWRRLTPLFDHRSLVVIFGLIATLATFLVGVSGLCGGSVLFYPAAFFSGVGTSALCLKTGRIYGSATLSETLFSGGISLIFASSLYFAGIGIPQGLRLVYISLLPLLSALLLTMPVSDPFPSAVHGASEKLPFSAPERNVYHRITVALGVVAFTAGVGKGITSLTEPAVVFAQSGSMVVLFVALVGALICFMIDRAQGAHGVRVIYTSLMVLGIAMMLAVGFGLPVVYLSVGEAALWLVFTCFLAYIVFKFDFSSVRAFGIAQAVYFISSTVGWAVGGLLVPYYGDAMTRMALGVVMAFMIVVVLVFVLTEGDVKRVVEWSREGVPGVNQWEGVAVSIPSSRTPGPLGQDGPCAPAPEAVEGDGLARARDPQYGLSARELEVLELFAQGRSANWIADHFVISKNTVRSHLRNIYTKLDVHTRQELLDFLGDRSASTGE